MTYDFDEFDNDISEKIEEEAEKAVDAAEETVEAEEAIEAVADEEFSIDDQPDIDREANMPWYAQPSSFEQTAREI